MSQVLLSSLLYAGGDEDIEPLNNSPKVKRLLNSSIQDSASTVWPHCFPYTWAGVSFKTYLWDGQQSPRIDGGLSSGAKTPGTQASAVPGVGEAWWSWGRTRVAGQNRVTQEGLQLQLPTNYADVPQYRNSRYSHSTNTKWNQPCNMWTPK